MDSIMQSEKRCYITGSTRELQEHHCFPGSRRKLSEKYGLKVWLTMDYHTGNNGVHTTNTALLRQIQRDAQLKFMEHYQKTEAEFIKIFGRNYAE